jgi:hypothetical protein
MTDESRVLHQGIDFLVVEAGELTDVEAGQGLTIMLTLLQHGDPREAGLGSFEDELLE